MGLSQTMGQSPRRAEHPALYPGFRGNAYTRSSSAVTLFQAQSILEAAQHVRHALTSIVHAAEAGDRPNVPSRDNGLHVALDRSISELSSQVMMHIPDLTREYEMVLAASRELDKAMRQLADARLSKISQQRQALRHAGEAVHSTLDDFLHALGHAAPSVGRLVDANAHWHDGEA